MDSVSTKNKGFPLIPEEENKCVWMKTGLVSYKLCDRNYHCESCPFDHAMRNNSVNDLHDAAEIEQQEVSSFDDASHLFDNGAILFHPGHCWVRVETHEKVRVGLDDIIARLISNVQLAVLPIEGTFVGEGESMAHIIQEDYVLPVISPLSGTIIETNHRLKNKPALITSDPKGSGWLVTIRPDNLEGDLKKLLFGRKALSWRQKLEGEISNIANSMMKISPEKVGPTMQDGGTRLSSLAEMLHSVNSKQLTQILDSIVSKYKPS